MINLELSNALAHDAKLVLSFITQRKYRDPRDPLRSLITLRVLPPMLFTAQLALTATSYTLAKHTGRRLGYRFREHLRDVERNDKDASKPVARHFNLPNHSKQHLAVRGLSLNQGNSESRKTLDQKFIQLIYTCCLLTIFPPIAQLHTHNFQFVLTKGQPALKMSALKLLTVPNLSYRLS